MIAKCPSCGKQYQVKEELQGKTGRCACGATFTVPRASPPPASPLEALQRQSGPQPEGRGRAAAQETQPVRHGPFSVHFEAATAPARPTNPKHVGKLTFTADHMIVQGASHPGSGVAAAGAVFGGLVGGLVTGLLVKGLARGTKTTFRVALAGCQVKASRRGGVYCVSLRDGRWLMILPAGRDDTSAVAQAMREVFGDRIAVTRVPWVIPKALIVALVLVLLGALGVVILAFLDRR